MTLTRLSIEFYEREEHLPFSGFDDVGTSLEQETMEKLFGCAGRMSNQRGSESAIPAASSERLDAEAQRHAQATVSVSLEQNSQHFNEAREKRDQLINALERRLTQRTKTETLFTIRWTLER